MRIALDSDNNRIIASTDAKNIDCFCQCCGEKVIAKAGKIKIPYFSHMPKSECKFGKEKDYKSEWHIRMQDYFPQDCQEIRFPDERTKQTHIADVYLEKTKTVIEFQHSPISTDEFFSRTAFHISEGRRIVWVFDESSTSDREMGRLSKIGVERPYDNIKYHWMYSPRKCLESVPQFRSSNYSVCVYTGTEGDVLHRIIAEDFLLSDIVLSVHSITMSSDIDIDEFFFAEEHWLNQEPYKSELAKNPNIAFNKSVKRSNPLPARRNFYF